MSIHIEITAVDDGKPDITFKVGGLSSMNFDHISLIPENEAIKKESLGSPNIVYEQGRIKVCMKLWEGAENYEDIPSERTEMEYPPPYATVLDSQNQ